ncbi:DUF1292 domain-containing protein [Candidatus Stoquefichus massiliensis]|uniref:DUF1292 domain-containing protein n=1 Tax=Candidatus Stoquefichus massiliensis TaxID=1470350 RepID=UPI00047FDF19|nr:DUF1292 domain-containing protein [Candidatus Stoquefichus massiliensis]
MDANKIQVIDDNGDELEFDVLFTFESDETQKKYVLYYDASVEAPQVYSSIYDDEGHLYPVETPEEWEMIEEVFNSFLAEDAEDEEEHVCCHEGDEDHVCCHDNDEEHVCCHGEDHDDDHECCCHNKG